MPRLEDRNAALRQNAPNDLPGGGVVSASGVWVNFRAGMLNHAQLKIA